MISYFKHLIFSIFSAQLDNSHNTVIIKALWCQLGWMLTPLLKDSLSLHALFGTSNLQHAFSYFNRSGIKALSSFRRRGLLLMTLVFLMDFHILKCFMLLETEMKKFQPLQKFLDARNFQQTFCWKDHFNFCRILTSSPQKKIDIFLLCCITLVVK